MLEPVGDDERNKILSHFHRTQDTFQEDVMRIAEWMKRQPHLPEISSNRKIQSFLLLNKCRLQRTKERLEMYYVLRSKEPEFFSMINPNRQQMVDYMDVTYSIPLPRLTPDLYRVSIFKLNSSDPEMFDKFMFFGQTLNVAELRLLEDFCVGNVIIADLKHVGFGHLTRIDPFYLKKVSDVVEKCYSSSNKGLHIINMPGVVETFLNIFKSIVPKKVSEKLFVHSNIESLYEHVPRNVLPRDYGGTEKSLKELNEAIKCKLKEYKDHFDHLDGLRVKEGLRPEDDGCTETLGLQGSFRKLDID